MSLPSGPHSLARAHTLLAQRHWQGADLATLVEEGLAPAGPGKPPDHLGRAASFVGAVNRAKRRGGAARIGDHAARPDATSLVDRTGIAWLGTVLGD
jgi:hypothetical protein